MAEILKIKDVMKAYLAARHLTHAKFAKSLTENQYISTSRVAITQWKGGKHEPETDLLLRCAAFYDDWRRDWALDCLKMKSSEVFDSGVIEFKLPIAG